MALNGRTELKSSSHVSDRSLQWASLHSWNLFRYRGRSRAPPKPPPARISHCRSLRNCRGNERGGRGLGSSRSSERVSKGGESRAGSRRDTHQRVREGMMLPAVETPHGRNVHGRVSETTDIPASGRSARPSSTIARHQQLHHHHHHHDHHHHHYHYHHHYHHFPRLLSGELDRGALILSASNALLPESHSQSARNADQERSHNNRMSFMNNLHRQNNPHEAAMEARDRLDERLRSAALLSHRHSNVGFSQDLIDEFELLFDDNDDSWSDDEIWDINIQEWLSAWGFEERWHSDLLSRSDQISLSTGLSKAAISRLPKDKFTPRGLAMGGKDDVGFKSDSSMQDDCSVCLEHFLAGQLLICLPCKHRFHPDCLTPWLESHGQCPYCRAKVSCERPCEASSSHSGGGGTVSSREDDLMAWMEALNSGLSRLNIR